MSDFVIVRGPLGIGKSTIAARLARALEAQVISIDALLDELGSVTWESGYITQRTFREANRLAAVRAARFLRAGTPVIFDGNFYWRSQIEDLIERLPFPHNVFTLHAPLSVCVDRDRTRAKPYGRKATREVYRKSTEFTYGIEIDANQPLEAIVQEIRVRRMTHVEERTAGVPPGRQTSTGPRRRPVSRAVAGRRSVPRGPRSPPAD
ncbi:MAG: AAA family ATPase [Thermoplasmata archaeon]